MKDKSWSTLLSDAVLLGSLTVFLYVTTFLDQAKYWAFYGVPIELVRLDIKSVGISIAGKSATQLLVMVTMLALFLFLPGSLARASWARRVGEAAQKHRTATITIMMVIVTAEAWTIRSEARKALEQVVILAMFYVGAVIMVAFAARRTVPERTAAVAVLPVRARIAAFHSEFGLSLLTIVIVCAFWNIVYDNSIAGAKKLDEFWIHRSDQGDDVAVVMFTDERAVGFTYSNNDLSNRPQFLALKVLKLDDEKSGVFELKHIGRPIPVWCALPRVKTMRDETCQHEPSNTTHPDHAPASPPLSIETTANAAATHSAPEKEPTAPPVVPPDAPSL